MFLTRNRMRMSALFVIANLIWIVIPLRAQGPTVSRVQIQRIDTSEFPIVRLGVSVSDAHGGRVSGLDASSFVVTEDGAPVQVEAADKSVGLQVVFVIDGSGTMLRAGASGVARIEEAKNAITAFAQTHMEDVAQDWVILLVPEGTEGNVKVLSDDDWTSFRQGVLNQLTLYELARNAGETPLFSPVWEAIDRLEANSERSHLHRAVVVFSDGVDAASHITLENVTDRAAKIGLSIHGVFLGPDSLQASSSLKNLADVTGGRYTHYTDTLSVEPMFGAIASQREQTILQYRSRSQQSGVRAIEVGVRANASSAIPAKDQDTFTIYLQPPDVSIELPSGAEIRREGASPEANAAEIEPRTWPLSFQVSWPDGHPREIALVACTVDGLAQPPVPEPPDYRVQCDVSMLPDGLHTLGVRVTDELGLRGESAGVAVNVQVIIPTAVPPTPIPTATPVPTPTPEPTVAPPVWKALVDNYGTLSALLLAFGALLLVLFVLLRRPRVAEIVTTGVSSIASRVREATEPFFPHRGKREAQPQTKAYLVVLEGDATHTGSIELVGENIRLGRDAALATVVFAERSVSRLHARISEREDGLYLIYDEGSTSGTYVNNDLVGAAGHLLRPNDVINLGRVQLQFKLREIENVPNRPLPGEDREFDKDDDKTEPVVPLRALPSAGVQDPDATDYHMVIPPEVRSARPAGGTPGDVSPADQGN